MRRLLDERREYQSPGERYEWPQAQDVRVEESQVSSRQTYTETFSNKDQMWSVFSGKAQRWKLYRTQGNGKYKKKFLKKVSRL